MLKSSPEKSYEIALNNLRQGKSLEKNKELLIKSITTILKVQRLEKDRLINSALLEEQERGYEISESLCTKLEESKGYVDGQFDAQIISLDKERIEVKKKLKAAFYTRGKLAFEKAKKNQDRSLSREAGRSLEKSRAYGNEEINDLIEKCSAFNIVHYHVKAKATESKKYEGLINEQFRALERLDLGFAKVYYNKKDAVNYDCEIEILFDELTIKDEESIHNKDFSKVIQGEQEQSDDGSIIYKETVRGYVHQRKKKRKLTWEIVMKINSDSSHCQLTNNSFTESFISRSVDNFLSGDERAIAKKYKDLIGEPLSSKNDMAKEAIIRVYKKIEDQLKTNH